MTQRLHDKKACGDVLLVCYPGAKYLGLAGNSNTLTTEGPSKQQPKCV